MQGALNTAVTRNAVLQTVARLLRSFPASAQVHGVFLMLEDWTIENGLLTPTMKLIRERISTRYDAQIEAIYQ
jgi:long-chain acyl-CoA synthetase